MKAGQAHNQIRFIVLSMLDVAQDAYVAIGTYSCR
jgi:hypothetical protein